MWPETSAEQLKRFREEMASAGNPSHMKGYEVLRTAPGKFDFFNNTRDACLFSGTSIVSMENDEIPGAMPGVNFFTGSSCVTELVYAEPGSPLGDCKRIVWNKENDCHCRTLLKEAGNKIHEHFPHETVAKPLKQRKSINIKVRVEGLLSADFKTGIISGHGTCPDNLGNGDVRIFKGPRTAALSCDGMIIRNAVASSANLHGTSLDKVWDMAFISSPEHEMPWRLCAMVEVFEPEPDECGERVINRLCTTKGVQNPSSMVVGALPGAGDTQPKEEKDTLGAELDEAEAICTKQRYLEGMAARTKAAGASK